MVCGDNLRRLERKLHLRKLCSRWRKENDRLVLDETACKPSDGCRHKSEETRSSSRDSRGSKLQDRLVAIHKSESFDQILPGAIEDFQLHEVSSAICRFAVSQS